MYSKELNEWSCVHSSNIYNSQKVETKQMSTNSWMNTWNVINICNRIFSVQFNDSVVSDSTWPHGLQLTRLLHPSLSPRVCSNSCLLSWWWHPTISSSVELHSMQPNSEKTIWSLSKLCFLLPPSCYNYSVFDQMANNFWSQTRCSRSSVNLQADDGSEINLKAVIATQHCFHEDWPQKKKKKKRKEKMDVSWRWGWNKGK